MENSRTNPDARVAIRAAGGDKGAHDGTPQIAITKAMISAGADLLLEFDCAFDSAETFARKIYRAMETARRHSKG